MKIICETKKQSGGGKEVIYKVACFFGKSKKNQYIDIINLQNDNRRY